MKENKLIKVEELIRGKKIDEAQLELSKLGSEFYKNSEYLYLRSKVFYLNNFGNHERDFTYVEDTAEAFLKAMKANKTSGEIINIVNKIDKELKNIGFKYITLELSGYKSGNLNK